MPNITKRTNKDGSTSFLIRVYVDETGTGHQITKSMTWRPPANIRPSTVEKEVVKQAALFEDKVKHSMVAFDGNTTFGEYALNWVENAPIAPATKQGYQDLMKRIVPALGHIRLEKLQSHHLEAFYKNLAESGVNLNKHYAESDKLKPIMAECKISCEKLAKLSALSPASVQSAARGKHVSVATAEKISAALDLPTIELFVVHKNNAGLSQNSILHYHRLISAVLEKAKRERLVPFNVAGEHAAAPRVPHREAKYLDDDQARTFLSLLLNEEDLRMKTASAPVYRGAPWGIVWAFLAGYRRRAGACSHSPRFPVPAGERRRGGSDEEHRKCSGGEAAVLRIRVIGAVSCLVEQSKVAVWQVLEGTGTAAFYSGRRKAYKPGNNKLLDEKVFKEA